jgi:hypothetical protein
MAIAISVRSPAPSVQALYQAKRMERISSSCWRLDYSLFGGEIRAVAGDRIVRIVLSARLLETVDLSIQRVRVADADVAALLGSCEVRAALAGLPERQRLPIELAFLGRLKLSGDRCGAGRGRERSKAGFGRDSCGAGRCSARADAILRVFGCWFRAGVG